MNILITGASKGIGKGLKEAFEKENHTVIDWSRSTTKVDITSIENIHRGIKELPEGMVIDILINNAGQYIPHIPRYVNDSSQNILWELLGVNFYGPIFVYTQLKRFNRGPRVMMNVLTEDLYHPMREIDMEYFLTKNALFHWSEMISQRDKIPTIRLYPPLTKTEMWDSSRIDGIPKEINTTVGFLKEQIDRFLREEICKVALTTQF